MKHDMVLQGCSQAKTSAALNGIGIKSHLTEQDPPSFRSKRSRALQMGVVAGFGAFDSKPATVREADHPDSGSSSQGSGTLSFAPPAPFPAFFLSFGSAGCSGGVSVAARRHAGYCHRPQVPVNAMSPSGCSAGCFRPGERGDGCM